MIPVGRSSTSTARRWEWRSARRVDDPDTGFVLTAREVAPQLAKVGNTVPVARAPWEAMVGTACPLGSRVLPSS